MPALWWHRLLGVREAESWSRSPQSYRRHHLKWPRFCAHHLTSSTPEPAPSDTKGANQGHCHRVELPLHHLVEVTHATELLLHELQCDNWYVACRHDHQLVVRLTRQSVAKYAVSFQCRPEVEKAVYHSSRAWAMWVIPLQSQDNLTSQQIAAINTKLAGMH